GDADGGITPGNQANTNLSFVADPNDPNVVFIGGDRQVNVDRGPGWSARIFRGDASLAAAAQWTQVVLAGANGTAQHPDSRNMTFDANGSILESDDGGIYR